MATLANLRVILTAKTAQYVSGIRKSSAVTNAFRGSALRLGATLGAGLGLFRVGKFIINTNREFEKLDAQLQTVQGSAAAATAAFKNIEQLAASTPFQIEELTAAFITLRTLGVQPSSESMTSLGNFASSMGRNITDVADAVRSAAGGMTLPLKLMGVEAAIQGDKITLSYQGAAIEVQRSADAIVEGLTQISDANFAGAMAREMDTLNGIISNTEDAFGTIARTVGEIILPVLKNMLGGFKDIASSLAENRTGVLRFAQAFTELAKLMVKLTVGAFKTVGDFFGNLGALLVGIATFDIQLIKTAMSEMANNFIDDIGGIVSAFQDFSANVAKVPEELARTGAAAGPALADPIVTSVKEMTEKVSDMAFDAGKDFVRSFIRGQESVLDLLGRALSRFAEELIIGGLERQFSPATSSATSTAAIGVDAIPTSSKAVIVNQTVNFSPGFVDGASGAAWLRANKGAIAAAMREATADAGGVRRLLG